jgi:hypothetical protein
MFCREKRGLDFPKLSVFLLDVNDALWRKLLGALDCFFLRGLDSADSFRMRKLHLPIAVLSLFDKIFAVLGHSVRPLLGSKKPALCRLVAGM